MKRTYDLAARAAQWGVALDRVDETDQSTVGFGRRGDQTVVIKRCRNASREARVLRTYAGQGVVRLLDHDDDAMLLEGLIPATQLVSVVNEGDDDRATAILADVVGRMKPRETPSGVPLASQWGQAFVASAACASDVFPVGLVERARHVYVRLCESQATPRLLHGDLHHENVLFDDERGWLAIDPKGVVAELEFELGAALRNPLRRPDVFTDPATVARRIDRFARDLHLDRDRILSWAFAQVVLALIWLVEDGDDVALEHPWLTLANNLEAMMSSRRSM